MFILLWIYNGQTKLNKLLLYVPLCIV